MVYSAFDGHPLGSPVFDRKREVVSNDGSQMKGYTVVSPFSYTPVIEYTLSLLPVNKHGSIMACLLLYFSKVQFCFLL